MAMVHSPGFLKLAHEAKERIKETDIAGYKKILEESRQHMLVDVREDKEYEAGHASGALHIGKGVIERDIEVKIPDKSTFIVLYCGGGFRSALVADVLQRMGYTDVLSLDGGWRAIQASDIPKEP